MSDILVAKIGGSTLGSHDTTLMDIVALHRRGVRPVVVHGGGAMISEWLSRHNVETRFVGGLRVTDEASLDVVIAVLAGVVNKQIVATLNALGAKAVGVSGVDGNTLRAHLQDKALGFVGGEPRVETGLIESLLEDGAIPVIAPLGVLWAEEHATGQILNINADTAAGAIAAALKARWLVFLTDVEGVRGADAETLSRLSSHEANELMQSGVIEGGMIPKVGACLTAVTAGCHGVIVDGREEGALASVVDGDIVGTLVGDE
jgi:acetylglutamate kinase